MTVRARVRFVVKEFSDGTLWIVLEPLGEPLPSGINGLDLVPETALERAEEIAKFLNENVESVIYD